VAGWRIPSTGEMGSTPGSILGTEDHALQREFGADAVRHVPDIKSALRDLRWAANGEVSRSIVAGLLGPQCFSVGVIAGIGADILESVEALLKLVEKLILADLYDLDAGKFHWSQYVSSTFAPRLLTAKIATRYFGPELRMAAEERDALFKELSHAFENPKATFEGLADKIIEGYQKDWQDFKAHQRAGTLEGQFRAGMIFGKLLMVILGLLTGVYGAAKVGAKVVTQLPRLAEYAKALRLKRGNAPVGRARGEAVTPSQLGRQAEKANNEPSALPTKAGQREVIERQRKFSPKEKAIAEQLAKEGKIVEALPEDSSVLGRKADALVNGKITEFKTLDPGADSGTVKNVINNSVRNGGQARDIVIDARESGLSAADAERGLARAGGISRGRIDSVRIIGEDFDKVSTTFE
jgi:hypothetical protein